MLNPFEQIVRAKFNPDTDTEEVNGTFFCEEYGCYEVSNEAIYMAGQKILTWECPAGHISHIEDYTL